MSRYLLELLGQSIAIFILLLFATALWHKLGDRHRFVGFVADYQLVAPAYAAGLAYSVIASEVLIVVAVMLPITFKYGVLGAGALLLLYAIAMAINVRRGRTAIECGCGGPNQSISTGLVIRNGVLSGLSTIPAINGFVHHRWTEVALSVGFGLLMGVAYLIFAHLNANQIALRRRERTL